MSSVALHTWNGPRAQMLDDFLAVRRSVPGRSAAVQQIDRAHLLLLAAQFQGFCRDLHSEAVDAIVREVGPAGVRGVVLVALTAGRRLARANARPEALAADFESLGLGDVWARVRAHSSGLMGAEQTLRDLNSWRNAIAHDDFTTPFFRAREVRVGTTAATLLQLAELQDLVSECGRLCHALDDVAGRHLEELVGRSPW